jgi:ADP-heptose:LPS heptosyltransferase
MWRAPNGSLPDEVHIIYVMSRVTLGADVAVTSVVMDAAKRRYPKARIVFVGPRKNYELFENDPRIEFREAPYARSGALRDRLAASASLWFDDGLVIDPDSRLTQLGLMRVCPEERYSFFESRSSGGETLARLPELTRNWCGDPKARPYVAPPPASGETPDIAVSLGTGDNPSKQLDEAFELELMKMLAATGALTLMDVGASATERARVERVLQPGMRVHDGAFAPFAAQIARSKLYVGYDSAGGHVASACGVPVISIARGFLNERMAARWRPLGTIVDGNASDPLGTVQAALATYTFRR